MKKSLFKILPVLAAVMLATSCGKDDNAPASGRDGVHTVSTNAIPFTIRVNTGRSLKKVGYAEDPNPGKEGYYNISFSDDDVTNQLKMIIKEGDTQIGEATIQSDKATFSGSLTQQPSPNADLTAEITTGGSSSATYSDKSLQDLLETCAHTFSGTFKLGDKTVDLTDQNAYLAISMSPCCDHEIKINTTDYTVKDGCIWISVSASEGVTSQGLGTEISKQSTEVSPGTIYTVARQYFTVADGKKVYFSPGNLQATYNGTEWAWGFAPSQTTIIGNAAANTSINGDGTVSTNGTVDLFGWVGESSTWTGAAMYGISNSTTLNSTNTYGNGENESLKSDWGKVFGEDSPWYTLSHEEWVYLLGNEDGDPSRSGASDLRHWASVNSVNGLIILPDDYDTEGLNWSSIDWATLEKAGAVFLPAAGYRFGTDVYGVGGYGYYWSSSADDENLAYDLCFRSDLVRPDCARGRGYGLSVRLVRAL